MLEEHKMSDFVSVNTKMNFDFKVESETIYQAINHFFENQDEIILTKEPTINIRDNNGIEIFISYKLKKVQSCLSRLRKWFLCWNKEYILY